jgi:hypothetical protein
MAYMCAVAYDAADFAARTLKRAAQVQPASTKGDAELWAARARVYAAQMQPEMVLVLNRPFRHVAATRHRRQ